MYRPWSASLPRNPFLGPLPQLNLPFLPLGPLSPPLLCFQPPRSPSPASVAVPTRPPLPRWRVSLCLTGSRLRRALPAPHIHTAAARRRKGGQRADGSETVDLVSARNSRETLPWCSRPSPTNPLQGRAQSPPSHTAPSLAEVLALAIYPLHLASPHLELSSTQLPFNYLLLPPVPSLFGPCSSSGSGGWRWGHPGSASTVSLHHSPVSRGLQQAKRRVNHYFPTNTQPPLDSLTQAQRRRGQMARRRPALPSQPQQAFKGWFSFRWSQHPL